jgi:hypothetical protein
MEAWPTLSPVESRRQHAAVSQPGHLHANCSLLLLLPRESSTQLQLPQRWARCRPAHLCQSVSRVSPARYAAGGGGGCGAALPASFRCSHLRGRPSHGPRCWRRLTNSTRQIGGCAARDGGVLGRRYLRLHLLRWAWLAATACPQTTPLAEEALTDSDPTRRWQCLRRAVCASCCVARQSDGGIGLRRRACLPAVQCRGVTDRLSGMRLHWRQLQSPTAAATSLDGPGTPTGRHTAMHVRGQGLRQDGGRCKRTKAEE